MHTAIWVDRPCFGNILDAVPLIRSYHVYSFVMCWIDISAFVFSCHCINIFILESCLEQFSSLPSLFVDGEPEAHRILQVKPILCSVNMTVWVGDHPHVHQPNNGSILNTKLFFKSQQVGFVAAVIHWLYFCKFFMLGQQWNLRICIGFSALFFQLRRCWKPRCKAVLAMLPWRRRQHFWVSGFWILATSIVLCLWYPSITKKR